MAKEYAKLKGEWDSIKKEVDKALEDIKANAQHVAQTSGIITEGTKEIGKRIQELKDQGRQGNDLQDFLDDPEVKTMKKSVDGFLDSLEKELKRVDSLHTGPWAKTKQRYIALNKELAAEIKARKKALSTKLGTGNKSLPKMEQLVKDIAKFDNDRYTTFAVFVPEVIAQHRKETGFKIQDEIRKAKNVRLTEYQSMMMEQAINTRHLKTNFGKVKTLYAGLGQALQAAETAAARKNSGELKSAKTQGQSLYKQLVEIADMYEKVPQDQWLRARIRESKDRAAIEKGLQAFGELKTKATETAVKIKSVKLSK